jgi:hypothetical protein
MKSIIACVCFLGMSLGLYAQQEGRAPRTETPEVKKACCSKGKSEGASCQQAAEKPACHQANANMDADQGHRNFSEAPRKEKGRKSKGEVPAAAPKD